MDYLVKLRTLIKDVYGVSDADENLALNELNFVSEDNDQFLKKFKEEFDVDMSGFNYYDFFYEDQFLLLNIIRGILSLIGLKKNKKRLEVSHLLRVARTGRWLNP